jgi:hypothetical protein
LVHQITTVSSKISSGSAGVRNSDDSASVAAAGAAAAAAAPSAFDLPESDRILQLLAQQVLPSTSQPEERTRNSPSQASPAAAAATSGAELVLDAQLDARLFTPLLQAVRAGDIELYQALLGHKLLCGRLRSQRTAGSKKRYKKLKKEALAAAAAAAATAASGESSAVAGEEASSGSSESGDKSGSDAATTTAAATTAATAATSRTPVLQPDFEGATLESDASEQQAALLVTKALLEGSLRAKLIAVQLLLSTFLSSDSSAAGIEAVCVSEARLPLGAVLGALFHGAAGSASTVFAQDELRALLYAPQPPAAAAAAAAAAGTAEGESSSSERLRLLQQLRRNQDELQQLITGVQQQQQVEPAVPAQSGTENTADSNTAADAADTAAAITVAATAADDTEEHIIVDTVEAEDAEPESEGASYASVLLLLKEVFHCGEHVSTPAVAAVTGAATVSEVPADCLGPVSPETAVLALLAHLDKEVNTATTAAAVAPTPLTFSLLLALLQTLLKGARSCAALAEQLQAAAADPATAVADAAADVASKGPPGHAEHLVWKRALFYSAATGCAVRVLTTALLQHAASKSAALLGTASQQQQQQQQQSSKAVRRAQAAATTAATAPFTAAAAAAQQSSLVRRLADCVLEVHSTDWAGAAAASAATAAELEPPEQKLQSKCLAFTVVARATAMDAWAAGVPYFYAAHSERVALLLQLLQQVQGSGGAVDDSKKAQREQVRYNVMLCSSML